MGDDDSRTSLACGANRLMYKPLVGRVQTARCLVEDEHVGLTNDGPRDPDALAFTTR